MRIFAFILLSLLIISCEDDEDMHVTGMQPDYISAQELLVFEQQTPQTIVNAGKIMLYGNYIFLGEINKGIHIIDISDTLNQVNISFLKIPGNKDIVAQNDRLYADNGPHLLTLDISDINNITMIRRDMSIFSPSQTFPQDYSGHFECYDQSKGWLGGWHEANLINPKCKTTNSF